MALTDKLTAIGDAIREKLGTTQKYTLDEMVTAIKSIASTLELNITNERLASYLESAMNSYTDSNYSSVSVVGDYANVNENWDDPKGLEIATTSSGTITVTDETDNSKSYTDSVTQGKYTIHNLIPNHSYKYSIVDSNSKIISSGTLR